MAVENGDNLTLAVALSLGTIVALAAQRDFTISYEAPEIDTDVKGDTATTNIPSRVKVTVSCSGLYDSADAGQTRLDTQIRANSQVTLELLDGGSANGSASATVTRLERVHTDKDVARYSAEFAVDGDFA